MECIKHKDCLNRNILCDKCHAMADIYNHYPMYRHELSLTEFMYDFETLAVRHGLTLVMHRAPLGCGLIFYLREPETEKVSNALVYFPKISSTVKLFEELEQLADTFKKQLHRED